MATVGRTTQGASTLSIESRPFARQVALTAGDQVTAINAWVAVDTGAHNMNAWIFDTSGNRLATGTEQSVGVTTGADQSFPISYTVPTTGNYLLVVSSENMSGAATIFYDATGATAYYDANASNGYPMGAAWDAGFAGDAVTHNVSIYATYIPAASGSNAKLVKTYLE